MPWKLLQYTEVEQTHSNIENVRFYKMAFITLMGAQGRTAHWNKNDIWALKTRGKKGKKTTHQQLQIFSTATEKKES